MMGGKPELGFSNPVLVRNKMQRGCSTMIIHPSPLALQGDKPAHKSVVLKPTDAQKGRAIKISVRWPTFPPKKKQNNRPQFLVRSIGNYSTKTGCCITVQHMHACVHIYTYMCLCIYVHVWIACPYLTV